MSDLQRAVQLWELKDSITTVVEANGYRVYDIRKTGSGFMLELTRHIDEDAASLLAGQLPLSASYDGEGSHGTLIEMESC